MAQPVVDNFHGLAAFARTQATFCVPCVCPCFHLHSLSPCQYARRHHMYLCVLRVSALCGRVVSAWALRHVHSWLAVDRPGAGPWPASTARPHIVPAAMLQLLPWRMYAPAGASDHSLARRARASTLCASALCKPRRGTWQTSYM